MPIANCGSQAQGEVQVEIFVTYGNGGIIHSGTMPASAFHLGLRRLQSLPSIGCRFQLFEQVPQLP